MPDNPPKPITDDELIALCAQKIATVAQIDKSVQQHNQQIQAMTAQRATLVSEIAQIKAAIKGATA